MNTNIDRIQELVKRMVEWRTEYSDAARKLESYREKRNELAAALDVAHTLYDELEEKVDNLDAEMEEIKAELDSKWDDATMNLDEEPEKKPQAKKKGKK